MRLRTWQTWLPTLIVAGTAGCAAGAGGGRSRSASPLAGPGQSALVSFADSFVSSHGADSGFICDRFEPAATGYRFTESFAYGPRYYRTTDVYLSPGLVVDSVRARGNSHGLVLDIDATYSGRRVGGWFVVTEADTLRRVAIETELPDSAFDAAAQMALLPTFDWHVGMKRNLHEFDPERGRTNSSMLEVVAEERITVPAGTFDTYRAEMTQARSLVWLWFTRAAPHRPVKVVDPVHHWTTELVALIE